MYKNQNQGFIIPIIIVIVAILAIGGGVYFSNKNHESVETKETPSMHDESAQEENHVEGVVLLNGKLMAQIHGQSSPITEQVTLSDGTTINVDGSILKSDGTHITLNEGESFWETGVVMSKEETESMTSDEHVSAGSYIPYSSDKIALASKGPVVLFFRASWCPTCHALDADIRSHLNNIPANVTILDVNYDNSQELKVKYGVTYQHTLVQVDSNGNMIAKWAGSPTLAAVVAQIKA